MNNNAGANGTMPPLKIRILGWILIAGTVIALILTLVFASIFAEDYRYAARAPYKLSSFEYDAADGRYSRIQAAARENAQYGEGDSNLREYYALGEYFYDVSMLNIYNTLGDKAKTEYWTKRRDEAAAGTGTLIDHTAVIDYRFEQ